MDHFSEGKLITVIKSFIFKGDKYANIYHRFSCGWSEKISHISSADSMKDSNRYKGVFFIGKLVNLVIRRCILNFIFLYQNDAQIALLFIKKKNLCSARIRGTRASREIDSLLFKTSYLIVWINILLKWRMRAHELLRTN